MIDTQTRNRFIQLSSPEKHAFITLLIFNLTISARGTYDLPEEKRVKKLLIFNEIIHRASSELHALQEEGAMHRSPEAFVDGLFEWAGPLCESDLTWAIQRAFPKAKV